MAGGKLVLVGTPLGNREDLSDRARRSLLEADLLLCEDTRSPQRLLPDVALPERVSCFVGNEHQRVALLLERLETGQTVAFVSEAGLPVWSDPGRLLVAAAVDAGFEVDVIPGPTAGTCALAASGFVAEGARFLGFIPRGGKQRDAILGQLADETGAVVIYEAGNRTPALLRELAAQVGTRRVLVARELTKLHQEMLRGSAAELAVQITEPLRGEVTLVIEGAPPSDSSSDVAPAEQAARAVLDVMLDTTLKPRARAKALATLTGLDARTLYERLAT
ncbi:16S rRNA (cytidine(1402)-2'-O)-methyltransferase [Enhygromyxa salina]|uniref:Ribosomal RNA small subunit methyltransferase I n=1 Tax=Enhygromyxa salina TaxID=215803 RepID=A0A2S9YIB9_9BACT|nr:16S rRNA (cytidine(1402)-2'-O)-methyltransferase [Enhygromyxa salina]PRQ04857.1 Ribosomal RNA small subunit methyltransferase I [Enhygromyxa salina]